MIYNFKEYKPTFDTPMKRQQELAVSRKIMDLLNKNKYDNLEEFITKNNNYQDFLKKNDMTNVVKHFGNTLKEDDYIKILENLRTLTKNKQSNDKSQVKTTTIEDKQYVHFEGDEKDIFLDNSITNKSIEEQMNNLQPTQQDFQTTNKKTNTENIFKELERKKEVFDLKYLHDIDYDSLNEEKKQLLNTATLYQDNIDGTIRIDLDKAVIVDDQNNIFRIEKQNGEYSIIKGENGVEHKPNTERKTYQKSLKPSSNTIYNN